MISMLQTKSIGENGYETTKILRAMAPWGVRSGHSPRNLSRVRIQNRTPDLDPALEALNQQDS